ncbi:ribonuclease HI family protein [Candidatus Dependentiae bacterium]
MQNENSLCKKGDVTYWKLFIDGASRNNPGPAGAGIYLLKNNEPVLKQGFFLDSKTNNQAEYLSLLIGIFFLKKQVCKDDIVMIISDSQLLVRQLLGEYKVKNSGLRPFFQLSNQLLSGINYNIAHVLRHENKVADKMANIGIDKGERLPKDFLDLLQRHEIQL